MLDLMVLAFQTDSTRVASMMFANDVSGRNFSFLEGVSGGHHELSHHEIKDSKIEEFGDSEKRLILKGTVKTCFRASLKVKQVQTGR